MPDRMGYSVIFMFKRSYSFSCTVWFPFPWSSCCSLSELMMWVRSNSTWQNKSEDVKSSFLPVSPVSKQMSFHPSEKLFSTGSRLLDLVKLCGFLHMETVLGFVCVGIYVLVFCLWSLRWRIKERLFRQLILPCPSCHLPPKHQASQAMGSGRRTALERGFALCRDPMMSGEQICGLRDDSHLSFWLLDN